MITTSTTLTSDIGPCKGNGVTIGASGITLDCAGHTITGSGPTTESNGKYGIGIQDVSSVTVKNCKVTEFTRGFFLNYTSFDILSGNNATGDRTGFVLQGRHTVNNTLIDNTANGNGGGIGSKRADNNTFIGNTTSNNLGVGIGVWGNGDLVKNNVADNNGITGFTNSYIARKAPNVFVNDECSGNGHAGSEPTGLCSPQP